jgi:hypothetical protein
MSAVCIPEVLATYASTGDGSRCISVLLTSPEVISISGASCCRIGGGRSEG